MDGKRMLTHLAIAAALASAALAAEPPEGKQQAQAEEQALREAVKGFRGFLLGQVVAQDDEGLVLYVQAVTLVEGCEAADPGVLLGRETAVRLATEEDEEGHERPVPWLARAARHIGKMPVIAFGGLGGGNAMVTVNVGPGGDAPRAAGVRMARRTVTMRIDGQEIRVQGGDEEPEEKPRGPAATVRVQADEEGALVMDRIMPGSHAAGTWDAMPTLRVGEKKPAEREKEPGETDF